MEIRTIAGGGGGRGGASSHRLPVRGGRESAAVVADGGDVCDLPRTFGTFGKSIAILAVRTRFWRSTTNKRDGRVLRY